VWCSVGRERRSHMRSAGRMARRWPAEGPNEARKGEVGTEASDGEPRVEAESHPRHQGYTTVWCSVGREHGARDGVVKLPVVLAKLLSFSFYVRDTIICAGSSGKNGTTIRDGASSSREGDHGDQGCGNV